jgi:hypothetical protein
VRYTFQQTIDTQLAHGDADSGGGNSLHNLSRLLLRTRLIDHLSAHGTCFVDCQPLIDAFGMEFVAARKHPQLFFFLILGIANGASW